MAYFLILMRLQSSVLLYEICFLTYKDFFLNCVCVRALCAHTCSHARVHMCECACVLRRNGDRDGPSGGRLRSEKHKKFK